MGVVNGKRGGMSTSTLLLMTASAMVTYDRPSADISGSARARPALTAGDTRVRRPRPRVVSIDTGSNAKSAVLRGISTAICGSTGYNYYGR